MCGTCSTHGTDCKCIPNSSNNLNGRDYTKDIHVREDNIEISLKEMRWQGMDGTELAQEPIAGLCEHSNTLPVSTKGRKILEQLTTIRFTKGICSMELELC
jgi:hypothetical protein